MTDAEQRLFLLLLGVTNKLDANDDVVLLVLLLLLLLLVLLLVALS